MGSSRRPVADDLRSEAIRLSAEHGIAEAVRRTGLARTSIARWAVQAGVDTVAVTTAKNREALLAAAGRRKAQLAEANERAVALLTTARDVALQKTVDTIKSGGDITVHELVGVWTRATHDLALISGEATERIEEIPAEVRVENLRQSLEAYFQGIADAQRLSDPPGGPHSDPDVIDVAASPTMSGAPQNAT